MRASGAWSTPRRRRPTATSRRCPRSRRCRPRRISPYGATKLAGEVAMQVYARAFGLETVCLRYFNVFGPRQDPKSEYAAVIPKFITAALAGKQPRIFGDGKQSRDFCHIDNVVEANFAAAGADAGRASGRVFNVACGECDRSQSGRRADRRHPGKEAGGGSRAGTGRRHQAFVGRCERRARRAGLPGVGVVHRRSPPHDRVV